MRRFLGNLFALVCLLLFMVTVFLWLRSFAVADRLLQQERSGFKGVLSSRGSIALFSYDWSDFTPGKFDDAWVLTTGAPIDVAEEESTKAVQHRTFLGFWFFRDTKLPQAPGQTMPGWCMVFPYWYFAALFSLMPLARLLKMSRRTTQR